MESFAQQQLQFVQQVTSLPEVQFGLLQALISTTDALSSLSVPGSGLQHTQPPGNPPDSIIKQTEVGPYCIGILSILS